jgi:hypothetical protein
MHMPSQKKHQSKSRRNNPATQRAYFLKNKDKIYADNRAWRKRNPEKIRKYRRTYAAKYPIEIEEKNFRTKVIFLKKVNLTFDEFKQMLDEQKHLCAICGKPEMLTHQSGTPRLLCIDHNHKTGAVRGLLCQRCNSALGFFNDDPNLIRRALAYLEKYGDS